MGGNRFAPTLARSHVFHKSRIGAKGRAKAYDKKGMAKHFRPWNPRQKRLLPPEITEFIPEGHASHFVRDLVVEQLDLAAILDTYEEERGFPPFHPAIPGQDHRPG